MCYFHLTLKLVCENVVQLLHTKAVKHSCPRLKLDFCSTLVFFIIQVLIKNMNKVLILQ